MSNVHCICHRPALACADTGDRIKYIKDLETTLKETWHFFENTLKPTSIFMQVQTKLQNFALTDKTKKFCQKKTE